MKITFVLPYATLAGGIRVVAIYAAALQRRGHQVTVVSVAAQSVPTIRKIKSVLRGRGWPRPERPAPFFDGGEVRYTKLKHCGPVTAEDLPDADVVIATWWATAEWVTALPPEKGVHVSFVQHHEVHPYLPVDRVKATYRLPMRRIAISSWLVEVLREDYDDEDVVFVPNGVDLAQFHALPRGKQDRPTVGFMYGHAAFKGMPLALATIELLRASFPDLRVLVFGAQPPGEDLPDDIEYFENPAQERIRDIYAQCDVWLCSSSAEGFFLPMLEAMACRCPFVSTCVGGPIDIVENGHNGFLVPIDDAMPLAQKAAEVLAMPEEEWKAMSDAAWQTSQRHDWDKSTDRFEAALQSFVVDRTSVL